ncbi:MAG: TPM domain-containing protein [Proteobacteria bacterium]|nr:TPM domain-containing protein [Pseudomonadota bacterium]
MRLINLIFIFLFITAFTVPNPKGYINDYANVIDSEHEKRLQSIAQDLKDKGIAEIALLTVNKIEGGDITDFVQKVFDNWKIGEKGKDNGLLIVFSLEDRKIRINTGYGLEGVLPDGLVGEIIDNKAIPYFKNGNYSEGLLQTVITISKILKGEIKPAKGNKKRASSLLLITIIVFILIIRILSNSKIRKGYYYYGGFGGGMGGGFGSFGGGGFGGFGGGASGGGGAGRSW